RDASWASMPYPNLPATWGTSWIRIGSHSLSQLTMSFEGSLLLVAAGAIVSFRQAWSLMLGALINYLILAPMMLDRGVIPSASFRNISSWSLWIGVPMLLTSSLLLFFLQWRVVVRALGNVTAFLRRGRASPEDPLAHIEVPGSWFVAGFTVFGAL